MNFLKGYGLDSVDARHLSHEPPLTCDRFFHPLAPAARQDREASLDDARSSVPVAKEEDVGQVDRRYSYNTRGRRGPAIHLVEFSKIHRNHGVHLVLYPFEDPR